MANGMKVNLSGALMNAVRCIEQLRDELKGRCDPDEFEDIEGDLQPLYSAESLKEIAKHARDTRRGEHTVDEFAEFYRLKEGR